MAIRPLVIDINHEDASEEDRDGKTVDLIDFTKAKRAGVLAIIHKATEGEHFIDPLYASRKTKALAAGLMWGAYHFMRPGDVGNQVSAFLNAVGHFPRAGQPFVRYALDYEDERCGLWQAERWLELVHSVTGQRPWLYGGGVLKDQLSRRQSPQLAQYPLWLAEYGTVAKVPPPWKEFLLWQRSGDGEGPGIHDIPGIGRREDINYFGGTDDQLKQAWADLGPGAAQGVA